jgi:GntR family histidine utilization transcriptional repressor
LLDDWPTHSVFHSLLMHFDDEVPVQVADRYVDPAPAPGYLDQNFAELTPNRYLSEVAALGRGEHVVEAVQGSQEDCRLLRIRRAEPCLQIRRHTWYATALVSLVHPGSRSRLEGTFGA